MKIIRNENIRPFDVDETLVFHHYVDDVRSVFVTDPHSRPAQMKMYVNEAMVRLLKDEHQRGGCVVVWSRGGYEWAEAVIEALELERYVDYVMTKPVIYYDDKEVNEWLKDRVYLGPKVIYKQHYK